MGIAYNAAIVRDNLVLCLDAANPKNYNLTEVEVLVVAGGGGGGYGENNVNGGGGGGGGAGGVIYSNSQSITPGSAITVTVGAGGAVLANSGSAGNNGANSVFGSLTAIGGGAGGGGDFEGSNAGATGGSGGGAGGDGTYGPSIFSAGTSGQGFAGGARNGSTNRAAAGGGGAGGAGSSATAYANGTGKGGAGGPGLGFNISGTFTYYAGGGGGGASQNFSSGPVNSEGGIGGGGAGGGASGPSNGTANTGGGGGGGYGSNAGAGGSGIVIVRYQGPQKAIGGTITSNSGYTIHTFTTSSTFTPLVATNNSAILGLSDFSGGGNFGTSVNGPTYSSANGGSLVFDGTNDYVSIPLSTSLNKTQGTMNFWVYPTRYNGSNGYFVNRDSSTYNAVDWLWIGPYSDTFYFRLGNGSDCCTNDLSFGSVSSVIPLNSWTNMCFTWVSNGTSAIYKNGTLYTSRSIGNVPSTNPSATGIIGLGHGGNGDEFFAGRIAQTQIYNRALSAAEVSQNYNALKSRYI